MTDPDLMANAPMTTNSEVNEPGPIQPAPCTPSGWTAVVLAGERPDGDPLAAALRVPHKANIVVGGAPMLARVVRALQGANGIGTIVVVGRTPDILMEAGLVDAPENTVDVRFVQAGRGIADSLCNVVQAVPDCWPLLVTTADHALLTSDTVREVLDEAARSRADVVIGVVRKATMLRAFPTVRRTWLRFAEGSYTGANLFAFSVPQTMAAIEFFRSVEQDRKQVWRLVARCGPLLLMQFFLRQVTLHGALERLGKRLGLRIAPVCLSDPAAGVDVDKLADLSLANAIATHRQALEGAA